MVFLLQEVSQMTVSITIAFVCSFHPVYSDTFTVNLVMLRKYFQQGFLCGGNALKGIFNSSAVMLPRLVRYSLKRA